MKNDLVKIILKNKFHCVFLSPHQDDAALSCGALLEKLSGKTDITVINFFTKAHGKSYTLSAKQFLKASGYDNAKELYEARRKEDKKVLSAFKAKVVNLDFEDALFRRKEKNSPLGKLLPEFDHVYPTYRWHIIKKIASKDDIIEEIKKKVALSIDKKTLVFAPFGIGNHADHNIARRVAEDLCDTFVLYSDFPYNTILHTYGEILKNGDRYEIEPNLDEKEKLIKGYKTQFQGLFPSHIFPKHKEIYFSNIAL